MSDRAEQKRVRVEFEAVIEFLPDEIKDRGEEALAGLVQDEIGHTGAVVMRVCFVDGEAPG